MAFQWLPCLLPPGGLWPCEGRATSPGRPGWRTVGGSRPRGLIVPWAQQSLVLTGSGRLERQVPVVHSHQGLAMTSRAHGQVSMHGPHSSVYAVSGDVGTYSEWKTLRHWRARNLRKLGNEGKSLTLVRSSESGPRVHPSWGGGELGKGGSQGAGPMGTVASCSYHVGRTFKRSREYCFHTSTQIF